MRFELSIKIVLKENSAKNNEMKLSSLPYKGEFIIVKQNMIIDKEEGRNYLSDLTTWTKVETLQNVFIPEVIQDQGYYL